MKTKLISIVMVVLLVAALGINAFAESNIGVQPGQTMPDFTVSLTDGTTATLSDLLKEKDLVVLNIFASWCGPCEREFPEMEEVYQANSENMVIVSVSGDPNDTMETISAYKANHNLTFPMGLAGDGLSFLSVPGFPTTLFIDRNGNVGFIKVGAFVDKGEFEGKVSTFLSPDYDGTPLASEVASGTLPIILLVGAALAVIAVILLVIGRWRLFRKAGKPGWHSIIPILSMYQEYRLKKSAACIMSKSCNELLSILDDDVVDRINQVFFDEYELTHAPMDRDCRWFSYLIHSHRRFEKQDDLD